MVEVIVGVERGDALPDGVPRHLVGSFLAIVRDSVPPPPRPSDSSPPAPQPPITQLQPKRRIRPTVTPQLQCSSSSALPSNAPFNSQCAPRPDPKGLPPQSIMTSSEGGKLAALQSKMESVQTRQPKQTSPQRGGAELAHVMRLGSLYAAAVTRRLVQSLSGEVAFLSRLIGGRLGAPEQAQRSLWALSPTLAALGTPSGCVAFACAAIKELWEIIEAVDPRVLSLFLSNPRAERILSGRPIKGKASPMKGQKANDQAWQCSLCSVMALEPIGRLSYASATRTASQDEARILANRDKILESFVELLRNAEMWRPQESLNSQLQQFLESAMPANHPWLARLLVEELQQRCLEDSASNSGCGKGDGDGDGDEGNAEDAEKMRRLGVRLTQGPYGVSGHSQTVGMIFECLADSANFRISLHVIAALVTRIDQLSALPGGNVCTHMLRERVMLLRLLAKMLGGLVFAPAPLAADSSVSSSILEMMWRMFDVIVRVEDAWKRGTIAVDLPWIAEYVKCTRNKFAFPREERSRLVAVLKAMHNSSELSLETQHPSSATVTAIIEIESLLDFLGEDPFETEHSRSAQLPHPAAFIEIGPSFPRVCSVAVQELYSQLQRGSVPVESLRPLHKIAPTHVQSDGHSLQAKAREWLLWKHPRLFDIARTVAAAASEIGVTSAIREVVPWFARSLGFLLAETSSSEHCTFLAAWATACATCASQAAAAKCRTVITSTLPALAPPSSSTEVISIATDLAARDATASARDQINKTVPQLIKSVSRKLPSRLCKCQLNHFGVAAMACRILWQYTTLVGARRAAPDCRVQDVVASLARLIHHSIGVEQCHSLPGTDEAVRTVGEFIQSQQVALSTPDQWLSCWSLVVWCLELFRSLDPLSVRSLHMSIPEAGPLPNGMPSSVRVVIEQLLGNPQRKDTEMAVVQILIDRGIS